MSNIDKQALNQEKIEWLNKLADMEYCKSNPGHWLMSLKDTNMLAKLALRSVALLDELEAKDKQIGDLKATAAHSNAGWKEAHEQEARAEAAEKRIAEQRETLLAARSHVMHCARLGDAHANGVLQAIDRAAADKGEAS